MKKSIKNINAEIIQKHDTVFLPTGFLQAMEIKLWKKKYRNTSNSWTKHILVLKVWGYLWNRTNSMNTFLKIRKSNKN